jgi:formylmethanofuran dehydrogenase subunit D
MGENDRSLFRVKCSIKGMVSMRAIMISGRTLAQGASCEAKMSPEFFKAASVCSISEKDGRALGITDGRNVMLRSAFGSAVLSARMDDGLPAGIVFIAMGPWANALVGPGTGGCGTPQFKGVEVELEATEDPVLNVRELFSDLGRSSA